MRMLFPKIIKLAILFLTCGPLLLGCSTAPVKPDVIARGDYEYTRQYMSWLIKKEIKSKNIAGLSVALVDDQKVVWAEGFGYADRENNVPATAETVYGVGSISKLFTATAAMQLAERGKLDIDEPLQTYLPRFSIKSRFRDTGPITPRNIMTHHSGLPSDLQKGIWTKNPEPFTKVVDQIRDEHAAYPPDFIFSYSNLGVTLLGHAIQNISGSDFAAHMDEALLRPMNMSHSGFVVRPDMEPFMAQGYHGNRGDAAQAPDRDAPAGSLHSNVLDLSRFMQMVFGNGISSGNRIIKPETLAEMLRPQNTGVLLDLDFRIGLGWMLGPGDSFGLDGAGTVADHSGGIPGFRSFLLILPEHKLGVVVLSNSDSAGSEVGALAVRTLKLAFEAKTGIKQQEVKKPVTGEGVLSQKDARSYAGWYSTIAGPVNVKARNGRLEANVLHKKMQLVPLQDGRLGLRYKFLGLIPVGLGDLEYMRLSRTVIAGHEIITMKSIGTGEYLAGEKVRPLQVPEKWLQRTGEYEVVNAGEDFFVPYSLRLWYEGGFLFFRYYVNAPEKVPFMFILSPVSDTEAVIAGLGRGMGETIRADRVDGREVLHYSGYIFEKK